MIPPYLSTEYAAVEEWLNGLPSNRIEIVTPHHDGRGAICAAVSIPRGGRYSEFYEPVTYSVEAVPGEFRVRTRTRYGHGPTIAHALANLMSGHPTNRWGQRPSAEEIAQMERPLPMEWL